MRPRVGALSGVVRKPGYRASAAGSGASANSPPPRLTPADRAPRIFEDTLGCHGRVMKPGGSAGGIGGGRGLRTPAAVSTLDHGERFESGNRLRDLRGLEHSNHVGDVQLGNPSNSGKDEEPEG